MAMVPGRNEVKASGDPDRSVPGGAPVVAATSQVGVIFGIPLVRGHWWTAQQDREHAPVAVVSEAVADKLFGTTAVLGKTIDINGKTLTIIGVRGPWQPTLAFYAQGANVYGHAVAQVLVPLSVAADAQFSMSAISGCKGSNWFSDPWHTCGVAALWGYGLDDAQRTRLVHLVQRVVPREADARPTQPVFVNVPAWLHLQHVLPDSVRAYVWVAVAFLALCLFNAAGVLAARFMRRGAEVGIRRALGAARRDVFAQHLLESGCLAALGGLLALPLVYGALALLRVQTVSYSALVHFDIDTFVGLCVVTVITGLLVGVYPAWRASARPPALQIKQN
jgi:putative ABC transport system permease protein